MEGGGARSLAGAGQVINCEITRPRLSGASSVQTDLWQLRQETNPIPRVMRGILNKDVFVVSQPFFASVFSKIKAKTLFSKRLFNRGDVLDKCLLRTKVVICQDISWGKTRSGFGLIWSFLINTGAGARSPHDPLARNNRNNQSKLETQQQNRKMERIFRNIRIKECQTF